jgi:hypothetical protein
MARAETAGGCCACVCVCARACGVAEPAFLGVCEGDTDGLVIYRRRQEGDDDAKGEEAVGTGKGCPSLR